MGQVYKARDSRLDRIVAIKISSEQFSERFELEARAVAALNHPNICTLHDVGPNYLVMEYIEGESPKGPMPLDEALRIARQIAEALEAAHERGITHRDLKPANIKVKPDGTVKVLDFGLAKIAAPVSGSGERSPTFTIGMTEAGMILGTASYMAPEQARGKTADKRADIFAFGVVLHELITGNRLFGGEDAGEMLAKVIRDEPNLSDAPSSVRRLLSECLQKDPRKRLRDIGDVWRLMDGEPVAVAVAPVLEQPSKTQWLWPGAAALLLLTTGALAFVHFREKPPVAVPVRFEVFPAPKTNVNAFSVSPDGRKIALSARGPDGRNSLWLRTMDSVQLRELPGTRGLTLDPAWSPDSQSIAFVADGSLKKIDIAGGTPQILAPVASPTTGISWSRQDVILFTSAGALQRIGASGGDVSPVTVLDAKHSELAAGRPFFLPDGKHFLYYRLMSAEEGTGIYTGSLDAKPSEQGQKRLFFSPAGATYVPSAGNSGYLLFLRGEALMAQPFDLSHLELTGRSVQLADRVSTNTFAGLFSASNNGLLSFAVTGGNTRQLTWFDREGKVLGHVGEAAARDEMALSPDGTRMTEGRADDHGTWVVWMLDLVRGVNTRVTFENGGAGDATWSPDGSQIVYAPGGGNSTDLYRKPANGASQGQLLLHSDNIMTPLDWSHDGRFLLYAQRGKGTGLDLWVLPMEGDQKPFQYLATTFNEGQSKFSPDGHWVVYTSNESGTKEVYVQPFPTSSGGKWPVSSGGGNQPRWSHDGKELFYVAPDGMLMAMSVTTSGSTFQPGVPKPLFHAPILGGTGGGVASSWRWDITPDGKRFLINTPMEDVASAPLNVVLNWQSALK
jgi:eukaryotic-like serine/threonine-protein kinase